MGGASGEGGGGAGGGDTGGGGTGGGGTGGEIPFGLDGGNPPPGVIFGDRFASRARRFAAFISASSIVEAEFAGALTSPLAMSSSALDVDDKSFGTTKITKPM
jgi:hypothetical protein